MPKLEPYNQFDPAGVPQNFNTNNLGDLTGQFPSAYEFAKTFVTPFTSTNGGGNGVTSLDDPTYLGFNIRFDILSPLFNGATSGNPQPPAPPGNDALISEPSTTNTPTELLADQSAVGYLNAVGQTTRASYLRAFVQGILEVQKSRPYYFQTIEGITEAYNKTMDMTDPFLGSKNDGGIIIGLLEAIDLKVTALFNLYKLACYDVKYRRNIIPANLRYFDVYVDIIEIRKFNSVRRATTASNPNSPDNDSTRFVNNNTSVLTFRFSECTFDPAASSQVFANVANDKSGAFATSSMKWSYGKVEMESQFSGYNSALKDTGLMQPSGINGKINLQNKIIDKADFSKEGIGGNINSQNKITNKANFSREQITNTVKNKLNSLGENTMKGARANAERTINSFTQGLAFGNAFGLRNDLIRSINNPQGLINSLNGAALQTLNSSPNESIDQSIDDNIFLGSGSPNNLSLESTNIFGTQPSGPALESSNLFEGDIPPGGSTQSIEGNNIFED